MAERPPACFDPLVVSALSFYLGCLAFGGLFVGASLFGGHDSHIDHTADHGGDQAAALLPLLSLRFWTFSLAFFGLAGAALTGTGALVGAAAAGVAGGVGVTFGYTASRLLGNLTRRPLGLVASGAAHIGREATLLLPVGRGQRGKIRLTISGVSTDLVAETDGDQPLPAGATVMVVGLRGNVAVVERALTLTGKDDKETP
jgi:membrane protein implicated in regulation of membrane protease activity